MVGHSFLKIPLNFEDPFFSQEKKLAGFFFHFLLSGEKNVKASQEQKGEEMRERELERERVRVRERERGDLYIIERERRREKTSIQHFS